MPDTVVNLLEPVKVERDDPMSNHCTPGRKGLNLTAEDEKVIDKQTDELINGAEECQMTREMVKKSVEVNYGIRKFLDAYECNCSTSPIRNGVRAPLPKALFFAPEH